MSIGGSPGTRAATQNGVSGYRRCWRCRRPANAEFSVIDIGGGYGVVTEEVVAAFPHARVTLQDYSEPMILAARERLIAHSECINYVLADLTDQGWVDRVLSVGGGPFDLAVSAIVIHNLRQAPLIAHAYRGVARMLKPGGLFLDYDLFFDEIGDLSRQHTALARGWLRTG